MRYRIIEESNKAGKVFFTAETEMKFLLFRRWVPIRSYRMDFSLIREFDTRDEAFDAIKSTCWEKKIIEEGIL